MTSGDDRESERAVSRLLSGRSTLSRPEHEAIARAVLEATAAELEVAPAPSRRRWWLTGLLAAAAAVALAFVLLPEDPVEPDPFTARGGSPGPQLQMECEPTCQPGGHVLLEVADVVAFRHVAVFAFRDDDTAIWYAPSTAEGTSVAVPEGTRGLLPFRIELDQTHPPGRYEVVAVFSVGPLGRADVREAYEHRPKTVAIVERTLEVLE